MKNKYQRMTKEEKKQIQLKYKNTPKGKEMINRLNRLLMIGTAGIILTIYLVYQAYKDKAIIWDYISAGILLVFSLIFIIMSLRIRTKELNKTALKEK